MKNIYKFIDPILSYIKNNTSICKYYNKSKKIQKYPAELMLKLIAQVLETGISWRSSDTFYNWQKNYIKYICTNFVKGKNNKLNLLVLFIPEIVVKV